MSLQPKTLEQHIANLQYGSPGYSSIILYDENMQFNDSNGLWQFGVSYFEACQKNSVIEQRCRKQVQLISQNFFAKKQPFCVVFPMLVLQNQHLSTLAPLNELIDNIKAKNPRFRMSTQMVFQNKIQDANKCFIQKKVDFSKAITQYWFRNIAGELVFVPETAFTEYNLNDQQSIQNLNYKIAGISEMVKLEFCAAVKLVFDFGSPYELIVTIPVIREHSFFKLFHRQNFPGSIEDLKKSFPDFNNDDRECAFLGCLMQQNQLFFGSNPKTISEVDESLQIKDYKQYYLTETLFQQLAFTERCSLAVFLYDLLITREYPVFSITGIEKLPQPMQPMLSAFCSFAIGCTQGGCMYGLLQQQHKNLIATQIHQLITDLGLKIEYKNYEDKQTQYNEQDCYQPMIKTPSVKNNSAESNEKINSLQESVCVKEIYLHQKTLIPQKQQLKQPPQKLQNSIILQSQYFLLQNQLLEKQQQLQSLQMVVQQLPQQEHFKQQEEKLNQALVKQLKAKQDELKQLQKEIQTTQNAYYELNNRIINGEQLKERYQQEIENIETKYQLNINQNIPNNSQNNQQQMKQQSNKVDSKIIFDIECESKKQINSKLK